MPNGGQIFVVREAFSAEVDGVPTVINKGERIREGHELLAGREHYVEPVDDSVHYDVEQTTAAPGEKRGQPTRRTPRGA